jgi:hypothetical protein
LSGRSLAKTELPGWGLFLTSKNVNLQAYRDDLSGRGSQSEAWSSASEVRSLAKTGFLFPNLMAFKYVW